MIEKIGLDFDMRSLKVGYDLIATFNTRQPPKGSICCSEIELDYVDFEYSTHNNIPDLLIIELEQLRNWADQNGVLSDLENRVYTWACFVVDLFKIKVALFLDFPDEETKTLFALCHPDIKMNHHT